MCGLRLLSLMFPKPSFFSPLNFTIFLAQKVSQTISQNIDSRKQQADSTADELGTIPRPYYQNWKMENLKMQPGVASELFSHFEIARF